jgi:hypothetical protein
MKFYLENTIIWWIFSVAARVGGLASDSLIKPVFEDIIDQIYAKTA